MRSIPLIGVTLDSEEAGGWSKLPWYALRRNYFSAIVAAGGLPVALPHHPEMAEAYLGEVDGLMVTGGAFDVDPALWVFSSLTERLRTPFDFSTQSTCRFVITCTNS